jgi:beta-glucosidase
MSEGKNQLRFPKSFLWGASVSTHQVEGGNHNQWSVWELETAQVRAAQADYLFGHLPIWQEVKKDATDPANYVSGKAADHFNRYEHDFALARQLNLTAMRSGLEWSRIEPEEGVFDEEAIKHYRTYFIKMKEAGMQPVITLWHWTLPVWFAQKGGFEKYRNIKYFTRYVQKLCEELGDLFEIVITLNEPTVYSLYSYKEHRWPPQRESFVTMHQVNLNLARAHRQAYKIIKRISPKARIGIAHQCAWFYAGDESVISRISSWAAHKMANEFFINLVKKKQDFLGLNYYFAYEVRGFKQYHGRNKTNDLGWDMQPDKMRPLLEKLYARYALPIMITESGVADRNDLYRKWWIQESVKAIHSAMRNGVSMKGYIHWSLLDNFEWAEGFWPRFGLIQVNYKTQQRKVRESAKWYSGFIRNQSEGGS